MYSFLEEAVSIQTPIILYIALDRIKMKNFLFTLICLLNSGLALSQTLPILPKEWVGSVSHANVGYGGKYNTDQHPSNTLQFSKYDEPRHLTIAEQDGQTLKLVYKTQSHTFYLIGTLSADGKQMAVANENSFALLNVSSDTIIGCGSSRGGKTNPSYGDWKSSYATWCVNFKAVN